MATVRRHRELWERIAAHRFDDPVARLTFTKRLARENGWTIGRAVRVVDEYRRFVFLAMTAGHPVTPSEDVDQAWHLHLVYTRDYWGRFCPDVLGAPLHHGPTRGGANESDRYDEQYRRTLAAYEEAFGSPPPDDIWPAAERRFGADLAWRRVNVSRHWVIPKPSWIVSRRATIAPVSAIVAAPIVAFGIPNPLDLTGMPFLGLFGALGTASIVASLLLRQVLHPEGDPLATCDASDPLEVALVGDEGDRLRFAAAAVATLGMPSTDPQAEGKEGAAPSTIVIRSPPPGSSPTVAALHARLSALGACTPVEAVKAAADAAREEFEPRLVERGLLVGPWWRTPAPWVILLPMFATLALGIAKIFVGVSREKPVGFLVFSCLVLTAVSVLMIAKKPRRTRQGDRFVRKAWQQFRESGQEQAWRKRVDAEAITPMAVALLGAMTLGWTPHAFVKDAVNTIRSKDGAGGGGGCGSAGSGCGGGGCGGCGGCGGGGD